MRVRKIKPPHVVENPDVKREWLSKLRAFKQGVRLRAKLGVLDKYLQDVGAARRRGTYERPHWGDATWLHRLAWCIKHQDFPKDVLVGFAETAEFTIHTSTTTPSREKLLAAMDETLREQRYFLRKYFGVFDDSRSEGLQQSEGTTTG